MHPEVIPSSSKEAVTEIVWFGFYFVNSSNSYWGIWVPFDNLKTTYIYSRAFYEVLNKAVSDSCSSISKKMSYVKCD